MQEQWPIKALHNETLDVSYLLVWSLLVWLINNKEGTSITEHWRFIVTRFTSASMA
jgi:hypothetical protein